MLNLKQLSDDDLFEQCSQFLLVAVVYGSGGWGDVQCGLASKLRMLGKASKNDTIWYVQLMPRLTCTMYIDLVSTRSLYFELVLF